jgi:hypothetical protein
MQGLPQKQLSIIEDERPIWASIGRDLKTKEEKIHDAHCI